PLRRRSLTLRHYPFARAAAERATHAGERREKASRADRGGRTARSNVNHRGCFLSVKNRLPPSEPSWSSGIRTKFPPGLYCGSSVIQAYARPVVATLLTARTCLCGSR